MIRIGDNQKIITTLTHAGMLSTFCGHVLSDFEREVLGDITRRFVAYGAEAQLTLAEWELLRDCTLVMAMRAAPRRMARSGSDEQGRGAATVAPCDGPA